MTQLSVVCPCYPPHRKHIPKFLEQMNMQTIKPDELIISLSEITEMDINVLKEDLQKLTSIPLQIVGQEGEALAAVNRNYGALYVSSEYILFLDVDDTYHIKLIEVIKSKIEIYKPNAILYHLTESISYLDKEPITYKFYSSDDIFKMAYPTGERNSNEEHYILQPQLFIENEIHHGHITVRYDIWQECPQEDLKGREDSVYVRSLLWDWHARGRNGAGVIIIPEVLTYYKQSEEHVKEYAAMNKKIDNPTK